MDLQLIGWYIIGLAWLSTAALAWRLGRTPRARALLALIYWLVGGIVCAGTAAMGLGLGWLVDGRTSVPAWLSLAMGAGWCLVVGLVFWRLRRYEW